MLVVVSVRTETQPHGLDRPDPEHATHYLYDGREYKIGMRGNSALAFETPNGYVVSMDVGDILRAGLRSAGLEAL